MTFMRLKNEDKDINQHQVAERKLDYFIFLGLVVMISASRETGVRFPEGEIFFFLIWYIFPVGAAYVSLLHME
ncbi:uncharacterized protein N7484_010333 [Penicillium longicatenatum]|uniref:uncharacterized protein n=1 Tax=Penicillium longicatenatum TaxID=1561947 RepID=UPI002547635F|nr:uncharacterized protein N7484_010333 [Penicillium longicatenatum]KAJ5630233.1 hypothetical protein N7484_010333 [Penicillium longicatenatum]